MGTRRTTQKAETRARELHASQKSLREIEETLRAEGLRGSRSTIAKWLTAKPPEPSPDTRDTRDASDTAVPGTLELLNRSVKAIERLARIAEKEGRLSEFSTLTRTLNQTVQLWARLTPPEPPDPDANPDMRELGAEVAARLHRLVDDAAGVR